MFRSIPFKQMAGCISGLALVMCSTVVFAQPVGYDFNDDGYSDFPVSLITYDETTPDYGAARIWSGESKTVIHTISSSSTNTLFGWSTGSAGDLDGDGKDDLIVGEPFWSAASNYEGRIQVFSGADASVLLTIPGPYVETGLGRYVTGIGDWNGDGTIDIVSSGWDIADTDGDGIGDDPIGIVFVFSGTDGSVLAEISDPASTETFGYSVFGLGDITGDGLADIAVVDPSAELIAGSGIYGEVYIFSGSDTAGAFDITNADQVISNTDSNIRGFAAQIDVMHPDLWLDEPAIQVINLTALDLGGVNQAEIEINILKISGVLTGTKGVRSSLKLAGDINLDGKVDALDIQDSISQLGTDPQATGVMPIVDINNDGIIDSQDIQVVMDGYGETTDVYEGLWDGTRLLAIAGGDAGFGSISGTPVGGGSDIGGGRRPVDGCPPKIILPPSGGGIVLQLLLDESIFTCSGPGCPSCDEQGSCYPCEQAGTLSGGEVSVSPSQPGMGDTVTFTIDPLTLDGRMGKCRLECGPEGTMCEKDEPDRHPSWVIEIQDPNTNEWGPTSPPRNGSASQTTFTGGGGERIRLRTFPFTIPESGECEELVSDEEIQEVQFATFSLTSETIIPAPDGTTDDDRTVIGIREVTRIKVVEPGVAVTFTITGGDTIGQTPTQVRTRRHSKGTITVTAVSNSDGTVTSRVFDVIEPSGVEMTFSGDEWHKANLSSAGFQMCVQVLPTSVLFSNIRIGEGNSAPPINTGEFAEEMAAEPGNVGNFGHVPWDHSINNQNFMTKTDRPRIWIGSVRGGGWSAGSQTWTIPWYYEVGSTQYQLPLVISTSVATVSGTGAMCIDKTTNNGIYHKTPVYEFNNNFNGDPWNVNDDSCP